MKKKKLTFVLSASLTFIVMALQCGISLNLLHNKIIETIHIQLSESAVYGKTLIRNTFEEQIAVLEALAGHLAGYASPDMPEAISLLQSMTMQKGYLRMAVEYPDGSFLTHDGYTNSSSFIHEDYEEGSVLQEEHFVNLMNGRSSVTGPARGIINPAETVLFISVPIQKGGAVLGGLTATYNVDRLDQFLGVPFLEGCGSIFLMKSNGEIISNISIASMLSKGSNFFEKTSLPHLDGQSVDRGSFFDVYREDEVFYCYREAGVNDWYIVSMVPAVVMKSQALGIQKIVMLLCVTVLLCLLTILWIIAIRQIQERNKSVLMEHCFHMLAEQSGGVILEWNFENNEIRSLPENTFEKMLGRQMITHNSWWDAVSQQVIYEEDVEIFKAVFDTLLRRESLRNVKFRIKDAQGYFRWCSLTAGVVEQKNGKLYKAIGILTDIDDSEKAAKKLQLEANSDGLTGLFNKVATERMVMEILAMPTRHCQHALIVADIDDFKRLNDSGGHLYGDEVLMRIARCIRSSFRSSDVLGRFGGDEFVIFIRDIPNLTFVEGKLLEFVRLTGALFKADCPSQYVTLSMGIAICGRDGTTYTELYQKADRALYAAKEAGKNTYVFYDGSQTLATSESVT